MAAASGRASGNDRGFGDALWLDSFDAISISLRLRGHCTARVRVGQIDLCDRPDYNLGVAGQTRMRLVRYSLWLKLYLDLAQMPVEPITGHQFLMGPHF